MKKLKVTLAILIPLFFTSCIVVDNAPGPNGRDGRAYFGVDYEHHAPYSYWDNNSSIPYNPILGDYYRTRAGIYDFEYFINEYDYWYGTYEIWINRGGVGEENRFELQSRGHLVCRLFLEKKKKKKTIITK